MRFSKQLLVMSAGIALAALVIAKDDKPAMEGQMPEMGPPKEMKDCSWLVGTWDFVAKMRMDPQDTFVPSSGTATYQYILDGAAIAMTYEQPMMGMQFKGYGVETFDRETKKWQMMWVDNMAGRQSLFVGERKGNGMVMTAEDLYQGQKVWNRISTVNETPVSFDWKGESSMDDGKTWYTWGESTYKKRK